MYSTLYMISFSHCVWWRFLASVSHGSWLPAEEKIAFSSRGRERKKWKSRREQKILHFFFSVVPRYCIFVVTVLECDSVHAQCAKTQYSWTWQRERNFYISFFPVLGLKTEFQCFFSFPFLSHQIIPPPSLWHQMQNGLLFSMALEIHEMLQRKEVNEILFPAADMESP